MTDKINGMWDKFKNPVLWMTLIGSVFWVSIRLNNVDVIDDRLDKKIAIQNEMHTDQDNMKAAFKDEINSIKTGFVDEIHRLELRIKELECEIK